MADKYPCPCCGHLTFGEAPGSYDICQVCSWEDDAVQLRWPNYEGGANRPSLIEAQQNYARVGAKEARVVSYVRPATGQEPLDPTWRMAAIENDDFESRDQHDCPWPHDLTVLYWWRPTFWRGAK